MNIKTFAAALLVINIAGCASFNQFAEKHPVVTAVGATLVAGSIVAIANANGHSSPKDPNCGTGVPHGCNPVGSSPPAH